MKKEEAEEIQKVMDEVIETMHELLVAMDDTKVQEEWIKILKSDAEDESDEESMADHAWRVLVDHEMEIRGLNKEASDGHI